MEEYESKDQMDKKISRQVVDTERKIDGIKLIEKREEKI